MVPVASPVLIISGITLALSLAFLLIIFWYNPRRIVNQFFTIFLLLVMIWNTGFFFSQVAILLQADSILINLADGLAGVGFTGACVAIYALVTVLSGIHPGRFRLLAFASLSVSVGYNVFLIVNRSSEFLQPVVVSGFFYAIFDTMALFLVWRYQRKLQPKALIAGIVIFILGQGTGFVSQESGILPASTAIASSGALIMSFAFVHRELIAPLTSRSSQLESMYEVSVAIASRLSADAVLDEIAEQAARWLNADAACIFLVINESTLRLVTLYNLPPGFIGTEIVPGQGVAGTVAVTRESAYLENYVRDWTGDHDLPAISDTFGSVICVPLVYDDRVIGVLMVIAGLQGMLFQEEDMHHLELLSAQAAVAVAHGQLFEEQRTLADQLKTLLESTENPVIAVDRQLRLIFANPAAGKLFGLTEQHRQQPVLDLLSPETLPASYRTVLKDIRQHKMHIYEISLDNSVYLCHLATLGNDRIEGWVAILNDVTQLKELDRIKSEMIRMTSHDLKNPLQAAMANIDLLRDDVEVLQDPEVMLSIDNIEKQINRMMRIIGNILDLERVRSGARTFEICSPAQIIHEAVDELIDVAQENQIDLRVELPETLPDFRGDKKKFERVLVNLIENAIKFTPSGGNVFVRAEVDMSDLIFSVEDTGIGIPATLQNRIFDRFFRGNQEGAEHISGTGLGLNLVKTVVDSHGGKITLESEENQGTIFYVRIPALSTPVSTDQDFV